MAGSIMAGDAVIIRYEGPKGGPGMREMLTPTSILAGRGLDAVCALITDGPLFGRRREDFVSDTYRRKLQREGLSPL